MVVCRVILTIYVLVYLAALLLLLIGTFGLFGQDKDPLSAVFLVPLGLPWNLFLDAFGDQLRPWLAGLAPLLNILILKVICRLISAA